MAFLTTGVFRASLASKDESTAALGNIAGAAKVVETISPRIIKTAEACMMENWRWLCVKGSEKKMEEIDVLESRTRSSYL